MAIDPMIANPTPLKLNDPMEQYSNYLVAATRQGAMRKAKREEESLNALNAAFAVPGAINPDGSYNLGVISNALAKSGIGSAIPGQYEQHLKNNKLVSEAGLLGEQANTQRAEQALKGAQTSHANAQTQTEQGKAFEQAWNNHTKLLNGINTKDPAEGFKQYGDWLKAAFRNDVIRQGLESRGMTPEMMIEQLQSHATSGTLNDLIARTTMGMKDATKQTTHIINTQDKMIAHTTNDQSLNAPADKSYVVGKDPNAEARATRINVGAPSVSVIAGNAAKEGVSEMGKTVLRGQGEEYLALDRIVKSAPRDIAEIDRSLSILNSGNVITGALADQKTAALSLAKSLGMRVDNKTLENTQLLRVQIANSLLQTIAQLKAQGVALTPMSNLDVQKLEAAGPDIKQDPQTLKVLLGIKREMVTNAIARHKELDAALRSEGMTGQFMKAHPPAPAVKVPPAPGQSGIPQGAIDYLRKHPETAAVFEKKYKLTPGSAKRYLGGH